MTSSLLANICPVLQEGAGGHQERGVGQGCVQREAVQGGGHGGHTGRGPQAGVGQRHHPHHHGGHPHQAFPRRVCSLLIYFFNLLFKGAIDRTQPLDVALPLRHCCSKHTLRWALHISWASGVKDSDRPSHV